MIRTIEIRGEWFRCVSLRRDPLSSEGARLSGGRLNQPDEAALYMASSPTSAVAESLRLGSMFGVDRFPPRLLVTVEVELIRTVDLTSEETGRACGVSENDLLRSWRGDGGPSPSQLLGHRLAEDGIHAALCPSVIESGATNLVIFVRNVDLSRCLHVVGDD